MTAPAPRERGSSPRTRLVVAGLVAGLLAGFFGVGGGIVLVPLLVGYGRMAQHRAHATSLAAIFVIGLSTLAGYAASGDVDAELGILLGVGGIVGSVVGASVMHRLSPTTLKLAFSVLLVVVGLRMIV